MTAIPLDSEILGERESVQSKLCDVIAGAKTWDTVLRASMALVNVRKISDDMIREANRLNNTRMEASQ